MGWNDITRGNKCLTKNEIREGVRNYVILDFNTSIANTRKQVQLEDRKKNLIISYDVAGSSITEKYVGPDTSEANWILSSNWIKISVIENNTPYEAIDLGLKSGRKWASKNIGASSIYDYGLYFQWGDIVGYTDNTSDGKSFSWSGYKYGTSESNLTRYNSSDAITTLILEDDAARQNMKDGWRMPGYDDFSELLYSSNCTNKWVTNYLGSGVNGRLFTSVSTGKTLFFPAAGFRLDSRLSSLNSVGSYWSRDLDPEEYSNGRYMYFDSYEIYDDPFDRYYGFSVRGVK